MQAVEKFVRRTAVGLKGKRADLKSVVVPTRLPSHGPGAR